MGPGESMKKAGEYNPATGEPPALVSDVTKQKGRARWIRGKLSPT